MIIETVRLSEKAKTQLITVKRKTGIANWNTLCRWALMMSLRDKSVPPFESLHLDSNVEMSWKTFSGEYGSVITAIFLERLQHDGISSEKDSQQFTLHLHRGISYLASTDMNCIEQLFESRT